MARDARTDSSSDGSNSNSPAPGLSLGRRRFLQLGTAAGAGLAVTSVGTGAARAAGSSAATKTATTWDGAPAPAAFTPLRPPAFPLVVRSPYLSTWMEADGLAGTWPAFWTGRITAMAGLARIDGTTYLWLGSPGLGGRPDFPAMRQSSATVTATKSIFVFDADGVELTVTFLSPVEPGDLKRQSQPLSYIAATARSTDGNQHAVQLYLDISGEWASDDAGVQITWDENAYTASGVDLISLTYTRADPIVFGERGDTAQWGTMVLSSQARSGETWQIGSDQVVRAQFTDNGVLTDTQDSNKPRAINNNWPVFAHSLDLGKVGALPTTPFVISIGHVREPAINYLGTALAPLWKSYYADWQAMVGAFHADFGGAVGRSIALDERIKIAATLAGGPQYAALCALALRQAYGGTELVSSPDGKPWAFLKEISSDGNVSTIDVTYPGMPVFLALDPQYLGLILAPILDYVENHKYPKTWAPHDLGSSYPNATGHLDGGGEEDMPVEESANMLLMVGAYLKKLPASQRASYATAHYAILKQWADYLVANALDPGLQNQTDDFTGWIAHSANLALKGIVGIGAMSQIASYAGNSADSASYLSTAKDYIAQWQTKAQDSSGKHLKLAYDQDGTWSLKYNGYPDRLLGLNLIPASVAAEEAAWYLEKDGTFGVPLDPRHRYTKADWEMWTAAWLKDHAATRTELIEGLYQFANTTTSRMPMTDWYDTATNRQVGFLNRPVVGGFFALLTV